MKDFAGSSGREASALRVRGEGERVNRRPRGAVAHSPDGMADIYSHLPWIGPGTFLVAAYINKRMRG
jgi:hypothetical protein